MIESGIRQLIVASVEFTALAESRLYPVLFPNNCCLPAANYQLIAESSLYAIDGRVNFNRARIQFDALGNTYMESKLLMKAIGDAIDDFSGVLANGIRIFGVQLVTMNDSYESEARVYCCSADYAIQFAA